MPKAKIQVETVKHADTCGNIPTEELRDFVAEDEKAPKTAVYPRDPSLAPQLVWQGKDTQPQRIPGTAVRQAVVRCGLPQQRDGMQMTVGLKLTRGINRGALLLLALAAVVEMGLLSARAANSYMPPPKSAKLLQGISFDRAATTPGDHYRAKFTAFDKSGKTDDPSNCRTLLRFPDGTVFFEAKMAIDADGSPRATKIDPESGQRDTSYTYPKGGSLNAEHIPYIVVPDFHPKTDRDNFCRDFGVEKGDLAVVIYQGQITTAILGDKGPSRQIGEASIRTHELLMPAAPSPWKDRNKTRIANRSVPGEVLYFVFPKSALLDLTSENAETRIRDEAMKRFMQFKQRQGH